jgi:chromate transporter
MPDGRASPLQLLRIFLRLGVTSFGGPIAHIGYFREEFVVRRRWLDDDSFADLVALCQFLPGPASSQVGFAIGCRSGGVLGGIAAWCGFTLPSALLLTLFALTAGQLRSPLALGGLHGLRLVAVAVVAQALLGMARTLTPDRPRAVIALLALSGLSVLSGSMAQLAVIFAGAVTGLAVCQPVVTASRDGLLDKAPFWLSPLALALLFALPLAALLAPSPATALFDEFYRAGALVFGGGHVVLPLLRDGLVDAGLISEADFLAGYGAAQAVPGPLFTVAAYYGAIILGPIGAAIALAGIFLPGLLALLAALPLWARLRRNGRVQAAMQGINAAVVGLLAAALYDPLWRNSVQSPQDFALVAILFILLTLWRTPPLLVVALGGAAGMVLPYLA